MIRGTSHDQDNRFPDKQRRMLQKSTWPDQYDVKVDLSKVDFDLVKIWISKRVEQLTKDDDDIPASTAIAFLEENISTETFPDPKVMHITMTGVLKQHTALFMVELWKLLTEAQSAPNGIVFGKLFKPASMLQSRKEESLRHRRELDDLEERKRKYDKRNVKKEEGRQRSRDKPSRYGQVKPDRASSRKRDRDSSPKRKAKDRSRRDERDSEQSSGRRRKQRRQRSRSQQKRRSRQRRQKSRSKKQKSRKSRDSSSSSSGVQSSRSS